MTNTPFQNSAAIDTNVFVHLLNPQNNPDSHINTLLGHLRNRGIALIVNEQGVIQREYQRHIIPMFRGNSVSGPDSYILLYWMQQASRRMVSVGRREDCKTTQLSLRLLMGDEYR